MEICEETGGVRGLLIVDKYRSVVNYLYPIIVEISHKHRVLRDEGLAALLQQMRLFEVAAKSTQISKLYEADAGLAYLRDLLMVMADESRRILSRKRYEVASVLIAEVGALLGAWIRKTKSNSQ